MSIDEAVKKRFFILTALISLIIFCHGQAFSLPKLEKGHINLRNYDMQSGLIDLSGEWEFYWEQLLTPQDFETTNLIPDYIHVPQVWNDQTVGGKSLSGEGFATYRVLIEKDVDTQLLSVYMPNVYSSYALWANGEKVSENGKVGLDKESSEPYWLPRVITFEAEGATLELVVQVSNFHHHRGGMHKVPQIGQPEKVFKANQNILISNVLLIGGLVILGAFFCGFFVIRRGQRATIYFGLLCISWGVRTLFSNSYLINSLFEDMSWTIGIKIEYISLYLTMLAGMMFITSVFLKDDRSIYKYILITINYCLIALTIILPPVFFTKLLPAYQFFIAMNFLFVMVVIGKALFQKQQEAWFSALSIVIGIALFGYELTAYSLVVKIDLIYLHLGYLTVFFLNSLVLAYQFVVAYKQMNLLEMEKNRSLYGLRGVSL